MSANARRAAKLSEQAAITHADRTATAEIAVVETRLRDPSFSDVDEPATVRANGDYPTGAPTSDADDRIVIGLGAITEMLEAMKSPNDILGTETAQALKAGAADLWRASLGMSSDDITRRGLAYEYQGRVIVRTMGRFLQGQARSMLTQAYYTLRNALREYRRFEMLDLAIREARQTAYHIDRPGASEEGVTEANWIDGDDRFDPSKTQAERATEALKEALPFVAAAFIFCQRVPGMTDGEPITARVKPTAIVVAPKIETAADRLRKARTGGAGTFTVIDGAAAE